jgi:inosine-uridine nucleoside N-ribohydrolase
MGTPASPQTRVVPQIPAPEQQLRVVIDSDAANETDDQWAIALAVLCPERFRIEGFVAAHFDNARGGPDSIERSAAEIEAVLEAAGMAGKWPVLRGAHPMRYREEPSDGEGVDFLIERALASSPEDPLWVIGLGAATDMASAYLKEPGIADRVRVFWHFRTLWPDLCQNFNVFGDPKAARQLFHSPLPFVLFDTGTHLTCPVEESEAEVASRGALGAHLHEVRGREPGWRRPDKGFFDLGDIVALKHPSLAQWEVVDCPEISLGRGSYLAYQHTGKLGQILRCADLERDGAFALLYERLRQHAAAG